MGAFDQTFADQIAHGVLNFDFVRKIDMWRRTFLAAVTNFQVARAAELISYFANEDDRCRPRS